MLSSPAVDAGGSVHRHLRRQSVFDRYKDGQRKLDVQRKRKTCFLVACCCWWISHIHVLRPPHDHHIYAVNVTDGAVKWKHKTDGQIFSSPTVIGDMVYAGSNDSHLYALKLADGRMVWKSNLGGAVFSSPTATDHSIYVGSSDGHMYALNREEGLSLIHI